MNLTELQLGTFLSKANLPLGATVTLSSHGIKVLRPCDTPNCDARATHSLTIADTEMVYCEQHVIPVARALKRQGLRITAAKELSTGPVQLTESVKESLNIEYRDKEHTSVILALKPTPEVAASLAAGHDQAEPPEVLHLTLCFLGNAADLEERKAELISAADAAAPTIPSLLHTRVDGLARFINTPDDQEHAVVLLCNSPELQQARTEIVEAMGAAGFEIEEAYGFTPHITLAYLPAETPLTLQEPWTEPKEISFDALWIMWGGEQIRIPLSSSDEKGNFITLEDGRVIFAGGPSAGGGSTSASSVFTTKLSAEKAAALRAEVAEWDAGDRKSFASTAINEGEYSGLTVYELRDAGELKAIASLGMPQHRLDIMDNAYVWKGNEVTLHYLATKERGYGRQAMADILQPAIEKKWSAAWSATDDSKPFYEALGFTPEYGNFFGPTANQLQDWAANKAIEDSEPESGVFVVRATGTKGNFITVDDRVVLVGSPGQGEGNAGESKGIAPSLLLSDLLDNEKELYNEKEHSRSHCMACPELATIEVLWAEGMGRAWFCDACYADWENRDDVVATHVVKDGIVPEHWESKKQDGTFVRIESKETSRLVFVTGTATGENNG